MTRRTKDLLFGALLMAYFGCAIRFGLVAALAVPPTYPTETRVVCFGLVAGLWPFVSMPTLCCRRIGRSPTPANPGRKAEGKASFKRASCRPPLVKLAQSSRPGRAEWSFVSMRRPGVLQVDRRLSEKHAVDKEFQSVNGRR